MIDPAMTRRTFCAGVIAGAAAAALRPLAVNAAETVPWRLRYALASCMYGTMKVEEVLPEVARTGASCLDLWTKPHGSQRDEVDAMGVEAYLALAKRHKVTTGILTCFDLKPFDLQSRMPMARQLGAKILVTKAPGPKGLAGDALKAAVVAFAEQLKPHVAAAAEQGLVIGMENHGASLIDSPDSLRWLVDAVPSPGLGIALAPYHLPQDPALIAKLIEDLGPRLAHFYAWQYGKGCMKPMPLEDELEQMPGRGPLDFRPLVAALRKINYAGWTSAFMHPTPRGRPILPTAAEVSAEIVRAQRHLEAGTEPRSLAMNKVLIVVGDATETVDTLYPYYRLQEAGFEPVVIAPEKRRYQMVLHEVKPGWTITKEWEGYTIQADLAFAEVKPEEYVGIFFSGGRAPEYIRYDKDLVRITKHFFEKNKPVGCVCHGVEIPAYAGCVKGRRMATVPKCKFDLEVCGGIFVDEPCVIDGNLVSGRTFHDHGRYMGAWMELLAKAVGKKG